MFSIISGRYKEEVISYRAFRPFLPVTSDTYNKSE
jgi:hypothetical protein